METLLNLAAKFIANFEAYKDKCGDDIKAGGPQFSGLRDSSMGTRVAQGGYAVEKESPLASATGKRHFSTAFAMGPAARFGVSNRYVAPRKSASSLLRPLMRSAFRFMRR
eukprot:TRINITY_DN931_c0_g2_i2.p1 TRINITY_DN931_c0_g2~~TRINITY_DN931_c0_g2_i2.p1  ORF type:complete len:110 (-),score=14.05 TRINITY_DN931_c0_g2_i2:105-434(-)